LVVPVFPVQSGLVISVSSSAERTKSSSWEGLRGKSWRGGFYVWKLARRVLDIPDKVDQRSQKEAEKAACNLFSNKVLFPLLWGPSSENKKECQHRRRFLTENRRRETGGSGRKDRFDPLKKEREKRRGKFVGRKRNSLINIRPFWRPSVL